MATWATRVLVDVLEQDDELVAAEARRGVGGADARRAAVAAASRSRTSPAAWPKLSLTFLNVSRSTKRTATRVPARAARAWAWSSRSISSWRLGRSGERVVERLVDRVVDRLRVGQREAGVLGEREQHLALDLRVGAPGLVGGDDDAADDLAVLVNRDRERRADAVVRERRQVAVVAGVVLDHDQLGRRRPPGRRRRGRAGCGASTSTSSGLTPAEATRISCSGSSGSIRRRPTVSSPSRSLAPATIAFSTSWRSRRLTIELWIFESRSSRRWRSARDSTSRAFSAVWRSRSSRSASRVAEQAAVIAAAPRRRPDRPPSAQRFARAQRRAAAPPPVVGPPSHALRVWPGARRAAGCPLVGTVLMLLTIGLPGWL